MTVVYLPCFPARSFLCTTACRGAGQPFKIAAAVRWRKPLSRWAYVNYNWYLFWISDFHHVYKSIGKHNLWKTWWLIFLYCCIRFRVVESDICSVNKGASMVTPPMNYLELFYTVKHSKNTLFCPIRIWLHFLCDIQKSVFKTKQKHWKKQLFLIYVIYKCIKNHGCLRFFGVFFLFRTMYIWPRGFFGFWSFHSSKTKKHLGKFWFWSFPY